MKKMAYGLTLLALAIPASLPVHAQQTTGTASTPSKVTPDEVLARYKKQLSLTDDQTSRLRPIIADRQHGMLELRNDASTRPREKMTKMQALKSSTDRRINAILTSDQQKKYSAMEAAQMEKVKERRQSGSIPN